MTKTKLTKKDLINLISEYSDDAIINICIDCRGMSIDGAISEDISIESSDINAPTASESITLSAKFIASDFPSIWLARDEDGELLVWQSEPQKGATKWYGDGPVATLKANILNEIKWEDAHATPYWKVRGKLEEYIIPESNLQDTEL